MSRKQIEADELSLAVAAILEEARQVGGEVFEGSCDRSCDSGQTRPHEWVSPGPSFVARYRAKFLCAPERIRTFGLPLRRRYNHDASAPQNGGIPPITICYVGAGYIPDSVTECVIGKCDGAR